jgi:predicted peroxiredoxin
MNDPAELQIIINSGPEDAQRATLGFAAAAAACACGTQVTIFLAMNGARWSLESEGNESAVPGFEPIAKMIAFIQSAGGRIEVCSTCWEGACSDIIEGKRNSPKRDDIRPQGLTAVALSMIKVPTVVF